MLSALASISQETGSLVLPVSAPLVVEDLATASGLTVTLTKTDGRSLVESARKQGVHLAAAMDGRFAFPSFQPNFDALFAVAKILELLAKTKRSFEEIRSMIPTRSYHHIELPCSFELKGGIMRKMSEDSVDLDASYIDGVKVRMNSDWILVLPDQFKPVAHIVVESTDEKRASTLLDTYVKKLDTWKQELLHASPP